VLWLEHGVVRELGPSDAVVAARKGVYQEGETQQA
jgi:hypothetical protein